VDTVAIYDEGRQQQRRAIHVGSIFFSSPDILTSILAGGQSAMAGRQQHRRYSRLRFLTPRHSSNPPHSTIFPERTRGQASGGRHDHDLL
jgi:hypothetical protein